MTSGHWEKYREHMFTFESEEPHVRAQADELPGALWLLCIGAAQLPRAAALRYAEAAPLHRDELAGALHGLLRVRMFSQDDAHIFCTPEQIEDEVLGCLDFAATRSTSCSASRSRFELSTRPENKLGTDEEWDVAEGRSRAALERRGLAYSVNEGDGAFYGPKIDLHMLDSLGRSWQIGTIQLDFQMPQRFGLPLPGRRQRRAHAVRDPPRADRLVRALHRHPDRALRRRLPVLARAGAGAGHPGRARAIARRRASLAARLAATASRSTTPTRPSARRSATPSSRRSRSWSSTATRRATSRSRSASTAAGSRRSLWRVPRIPCYAVALTSRGVTVSHLLAARPRGFNREVGGNDAPLHVSGFSISKGGQYELGDTNLRPRRGSFEPPRRPEPQARINDAIRVPRVRLIGEDGQQLGIKTTDEARKYAYGKGLDLVEVAAQADPPVAKVMDYGKFRYEQEQKAQAGPQEPDADPRQGDQAQTEDRHPRLRDQERPCRPLPELSGRRSRSRSCSGAASASIRIAAATC